MKKLKIKIVWLGTIPDFINKERIENWKSDIFEVITPINTLEIIQNADGPNWEYSDSIMKDILPTFDTGDIQLAVTNVPLQHNYYVRRYKNNTLCLTFFE